VENKVIVTVSLGAPRTWIMEEKKPRGSTEKGPRHKWILETGSLLVMQGSVQKTYTHEIPKEPKVKESRIVS
jgi:alkylated DNA repair dioxygenase AlkB